MKYFRHLRALLFISLEELCFQEVITIILGPKKALTDAESKAAGIAPLLVSKILYEYDYTLLDSEVKWAIPVSSSAIKDYLTDVSLSIIKGTL